jgi:methylated-DNA-protein-cysteine methyltransferase-like protein
MVSFSEKVYQIVRKIPRGKVATYGQIAILAGKPKAARAVGNILPKNPDPKRIPCYRVVRKDGRLAKRYAFGGAREQKRKLLTEGVKFKRKNQVDPFYIIK